MANKARRGIERQKPSAEHKYRIIPPTDQPPKGRLRGMEIRVRRNSYPGDTIRVEVFDRAKQTPLPGVKIALDTLPGKTVATGKTNRLGQTTFTAPAVEHPTDFVVTALKSGFTTFIYATDPRALMMRMPKGYWPLTLTAVFPKILFSITPSPQTIDFEIDQAFGWAQGTGAYSTLIEKAKKKGWLADDDWWATPGGIKEHFAQKGPEDMWTFFGHCGFNPSTGKMEALIAWRAFFILRGGTPVTVKELCDEAKKGNGPPGLVVLGGCQSADLLDDLIKCCVKVAVGFTKPCSYGLIAGALVIFWEALLDGKTLGQALSEVNTFLGTHPMNSKGAEMVVKSKPHINASDLTLDEIRKAKRQE